MPCGCEWLRGDSLQCMQPGRVCRLESEVRATQGDRDALCRQSFVLFSCISSRVRPTACCCAQMFNWLECRASNALAPLFRPGVHPSTPKTRFSLLPTSIFVSVGARLTTLSHRSQAAYCLCLTSTSLRASPSGSVTVQVRLPATDPGGRPRPTGCAGPHARAHSTHGVPSSSPHRHHANA